MKKRNRVAGVVAIGLVLCLVTIPATAGAGGTGLPGIETLISTGAGNTSQERPDVCGDLIAWEGTRNGNTDIYLYNAGTGMELRLTNDTSRQRNPAVSGNRVVWEDERDGTPGIYLYDVSSGEEIRLTNTTGADGYPDISGDVVVWNRYLEGSILSYNISTGEFRDITLDSRSYNPSVSGDKVVYESARSGNNSDIYLFNLSSGAETRITTAGVDDNTPSISGDLVAWSSEKGSSADIMLCNVTTGEITVVANTTHDLLDPAIDRDRIVWEDTIYNGDIRLYNITTGEEYLVSGDASSQFFPALCGDRVVWQDLRNGNWDIYQFSIGATGSCPVAAFTENATIGSIPFTVAFNDTSSGSPDHRTWDFGDGNTSRKRNPVHTYTENGTFSVSLTVDTPYFRDCLTRADLISVGYAPVPGFVANVTEGTAPLAVRFMDESAASPGAWSWDFGDGSTSAERNPVHIYQSPGIYTVNLTAGNQFGNRTLSRSQYVYVVRGSGRTILTAMEGLTVRDMAGMQEIRCNGSILDLTFNPLENTTLGIIPAPGKGLRKVSFSSPDGFADLGNGIIGGNSTGARIVSSDIGSEGFSDTTGSGCGVNVTLDLPGYPGNGTLDVVLWEGITPGDYDAVNEILDRTDTPFYIGAFAAAYTARFDHAGFNSTGNATVVMAVNTSWATEHTVRTVDILTDPPYADTYIDGKAVGYSPVLNVRLSPGPHTIRAQTNTHSNNTTIVTVGPEIAIVRIGEDGTGEVLPTSLLWSDPETGLSYYGAESPAGLSTFILGAPTQKGNIIQLIYLTISAIQSGLGGGSGGGGGGGGGGSAIGFAESPTGAPVLVYNSQAAEKAGTPLPAATSGEAAMGSMKVQESPAPRATGPGGGQPTAFPIPTAMNEQPGAPIFTTLLQVVALVSAVAIAAVAVYFGRRPGGVG